MNQRARKKRERKKRERASESESKKERERNRQTDREETGLAKEQAPKHNTTTRMDRRFEYHGRKHACTTTHPPTSIYKNTMDKISWVGGAEMGVTAEAVTGAGDAGEPGCCPIYLGVSMCCAS